MQDSVWLYALFNIWLKVLLILHVLIFLTNSADVCPEDHVIHPCRCSERFNEIQIWCSHGDLNSISNSIKKMSQFMTKTVDEFILENNQLLSIPGQFFSNLKVLRLMLRDNELKRLSEDWLSGADATLQELYVVEPELINIPDQSIASVARLEALTLNVGSVQKIPNIFGLSKLRYIQIEGTSLNDIQSDSFQGLPFLEQLHITSAPKFTTLDENSFHDLPKLSILNLTQCGINHIHCRALQRLPSLVEISFIGNKFANAIMVGMAIRDLPNLATIRLNGNVIAHLDEGSFVDIPSLRNLYLNHNKITYIQRASFHSLSKLRCLDLSNNLIRVIHPESFLPIRESVLEDLWLNNNQLDHASVIYTLLETLPNLRLLDISNNLIGEINFGATRKHMNLEMLVLENNLIQRLDRNAFLGMPSLRELKLGNNRIQHHPGFSHWNLPALKGLDLHGNLFEVLDADLFYGLPSLRRLDVSNNHLKIIEPATFRDNTFLEYINISRNKIDMISPLTLSHLHRLYILDFSHNNLTQGISGIPNRIEYLYGSKNNIVSLSKEMTEALQISTLKLIDLSYNKIHKVPVSKMNSFRTLRTLILNDNLIQVIDQTTFESLPQLRILNLSNNRLLIVKNNSFHNLRHLNELYIARNRIEVLEPELLSQAHDLKILDASGNRLPEIHPSTFLSNRKIEEINISDNFITEFPLALTNVTSLQIVNLNKNQLEILPHDTLKKIPALRELRAAGNKIQLRTNRMFDTLSNLTIIDLEGNELKSIESNSFRNLPNLVLIKLGYNKITEVFHSAFQNLPALQILELQGNSLKKIASNAFIACPNILMLNLSNNHLTGMENAGLDNLKSLEALDLSHNKIKWLSNTSVKDMNYLILLKLDNNRLCNIVGTPFERMSRLQMLSLRDNKLTTLEESAFNRLRSSIRYFDIDGNPVKCTCNMLWLKSWLRQDENPQAGPRCSDGTLLKEYRISRDDCDDIPEVVPGCEFNPFLNQSAQSSDPISEHIKKNALTTNSKPKDHVKPLPQETNYFDSKIVELANPNRSNIIPSNILSHFLPGDTPTIYAGTRTKPLQKPNDNSTAQLPSTTFTLFGMPIPSFDFNNLWNSPKSASTPTKHGRQDSIPHFEPEIQKDGFVPVIPNNGIFIPVNFTSEHSAGYATISKVSKSNSGEIISVINKSIAPEASNTSRRLNSNETFGTNGKLIMNSTGKNVGNPHLQNTAVHLNNWNGLPPSRTLNYATDLSFLTSNISESKNLSESNTVNIPTKRLLPVFNNSVRHESPSKPSKSRAHSGKAIISRVEITSEPSPHLQESSSLQLQLSKPISQPTSNKIPSQSNQSKEIDWYFANYNYTNKEPYVGYLPMISSKSEQLYTMLPFILQVVITYLNIALITT